MNYANFHNEKPELFKPIFWLNSVLKEEPGYYAGKLNFQNLNDVQRGYLPKWWRYATDIESIEFKIKEGNNNEKQKRTYRRKIRLEEGTGG